MLHFIKETKSVWESLQSTSKPIVLYGMGNGADKILDWCEANQVKVSGIFASDEFVRHQLFRGFIVKSYAELKEELGENLLIVIAFASERSEVLVRFQELAAEQEVLAPHLPLFADETENVSLEWLAKYERELQMVYDSLADDWSRKVFANTLNYKLSGKVQYLFDCETKRVEDIASLVAPNQDEVYFDLGAYNGDTINELGEMTDYRWKKVVAVEPDRRNARKLRMYADTLAEKNLTVEVHEAGIWKISGELGFSDSGGRQSTFLANDKKIVPVTTIDYLAQERQVTYIKMDVEGAELQAIEGGQHTLRAYKPKLFVAAYHYDVDLFRIPLALWQLVPEYKIYLRKHPYIPAWELNYICKV